MLDPSGWSASVTRVRNGVSAACASQAVRMPIVMVPIAVVMVLMLGAAAPAMAQERERNARIDISRYTINAEINLNTQTLTATAQVAFTSADNDASVLSFELNNAMNVSRVVVRSR